MPKKNFMFDPPDIDNKTRREANGFLLKNHSLFLLIKIQYILRKVATGIVLLNHCTFEKRVLIVLFKNGESLFQHFS